VKGALGVVAFETPVAVGDLCRQFAAQGVWIRPMGKVVYLCPAFVITDGEMARLTQAVVRVLEVDGRTS